MAAARPGGGSLRGLGRPRRSRHLSPSVPQLRTQDLTYFREMPRAQGYLARIRPVQPTHRGTFSCVITHDQRALARLYFFLNGAGGGACGGGACGAEPAAAADARAPQ